jgi:hypothetical protein
VENPLTGIEDIESIKDPAERAREIGRRLKQIPDFQARLREMRQAAVLEMRAKGMTFASIAEAIELHRNRVQQIAEGRTSGGQGGGVKVEPTPPAPPKRRRTTRGESA